MIALHHHCAIIIGLMRQRALLLLWAFLLALMACREAPAPAPATLPPAPTAGSPLLATAAIGEVFVPVVPGDREATSAAYPPPAAAIAAPTETPAPPTPTPEPAYPAYTGPPLDRDEVAGADEVRHLLLAHRDS